MHIHKLHDREDLGDWLNSAGLLGVGVEVGTLCGEFARSILKKWRGKLLHCIDPWERQDPNVYREPVNDGDWGQAYKSCEKLRDDFPGRVNLIRGYSPGEAARFADGFLDFVYIDSRHDLEAITADLKAWYPKVKRRGLFGGHDFYVDTKWPANCEVKTAVVDFAERNGLIVHQTIAPGDAGWWFIKP